MQTYSDAQNQSGLRLLFRGMQLFMLLIVFTIVYTVFVAVKYSIAEQGVSFIAYLPVFVVPLLFSFSLYRYRKMFDSGRMLRATVWTISTSSVWIIVLYLYVDKVTG